MTLQIALLFVVLAAMMYFFLTEKLPVDLTAFLGLVVLIFAGFVTAEEAFKGFASSAVITMLAIFIISGALLNTGIADLVGGRIHRWVGGKEVPLIITVMIVAGVLSAFMNNIAAVAVLMPAVASLGRKAGLSPSRLFMPLSFGAILGGTTTLVGTPPNILVGAIMEERGLESFSLFDFTPLGLVLLALGVVYMITIGRKLLPHRDPEERSAEGPDLAQVYELEAALFVIRIPMGSRLDGATLGGTRLGTTLGVQVVAINREDERLLAPASETVLRGNDELLVQGRLEDLRELLRVQSVAIDSPETREIRSATASRVGGVVARVGPGSDVVGKSLRELSFRDRYGLVVASIERQGVSLRENLAFERFEVGDELFAVGPVESVGRFAQSAGFDIVAEGPEALKALTKESLFVVEIPNQSPLVGATLGVSRMGELMGLTIVGIFRGGATLFAPTPNEVIEAQDRLLVSGERARITGLLALGDIRLEATSDVGSLESEEVTVLEATVAPRSTVAGRTLTNLSFRERFGLQVLALWREGKPVHERIADLRLRVGDALLLHGHREELQRFAAETDFVVLSDVARPRRLNKAPFALGGLVLMIGLVISGLQPIQVAAFAAATLVVLSGALTMEEAYRAIEWRAIFLVAAVLPVGSAMERSGAAQLLADSVMELAGPLGPYAVLAALVVLSSLLSQGLDGAPAVVLLAPVVLDTADQLGLSPLPFMMGVGLAASAAFMTPFSHKANLLVMGLGGYRSTDYLRVGTPLTIVLLALLVGLVPIFFPFAP